MGYTDDRKILRKLAKEYLEIAKHPSNMQRRKLWVDLNGLRNTRPMVTMGQLPLNELAVSGELNCQCTDPMLKNIEYNMRLTLYRWKHFRVDMVVDDYITINKSVENNRVGPSPDQDTASLDPQNSVVGRKYHNQIPDDEALDMIKTPRIIVNPKKDKENVAFLSEMIGDIIPIRLKGIDHSLSAWDRITEVCSPNSIIYDLIDRPEFVSRIVDKYAGMLEGVHDQYEMYDMLNGDQTMIHCTGAFNDILDIKETNVKTSDMWGYGMSQIFSTVSPAMHDEFDLKPLKGLYERFGLLYYGCCEPLDRKIDIIRNIKNVRKISISPWANKQMSAEAMHGDYVFSNKPNPALLAAPTFHEDMIRADLTETVKVCRDNNTNCELILKDVSTVCYKPDRLDRWAKIAMEVVESVN